MVDYYNNGSDFPLLFLPTPLAIWSCYYSHQNVMPVSLLLYFCLVLWFTLTKRVFWEGQCAYFKPTSQGILCASAFRRLPLPWKWSQKLLLEGKRPRRGEIVIPSHWGHAWPASSSLILNLVSNTREKGSYAQESSYTLLYFGSFICLSAPCPCNSKGSPSADAPPTAHSLKGILPFEEAEEIHINWV